MKLSRGKVDTGPAGTATEILFEWESTDKPDYKAGLASWLLECPGQSPAWRHYHLSLIHLRPIEGVKPAHIRRGGATHEIMLAALDPEKNPVAEDANTWQWLRPMNLTEQIIVASDEDAIKITKAAVRKVLEGRLWAEPPLSGQVEPWRSWLRSREPVRIPGQGGHMPDTPTATVRTVNERDLDNWFTYHAPNAEQLPKYTAIREAGKQLARVILANTPTGPDQTAAIRKIRESVMTANQAIACES